MKVRTTRFGEVEIDPSRLLVFPHGLLGFARFRTFALLQPDDRGVFYWLQSVEDPELAFVVTDPTAWVTGYQVPIRTNELADLGLASADEATIFAIVNRRDGAITANLQGPLVLNALTRTGVQLVLSDRSWSTRHELVRLPGAAAAVRTA
ncbi:MAG: flagellar assembly protein FliW [Phycisphaerales bacterium]|jgi:flagellar assembly factor FliW